MLTPEDEAELAQMHRRINMTPSEIAFWRRQRSEKNRLLAECAELAKQGHRGKTEDGADADIRANR